MGDESQMRRAEAETETSDDSPAPATPFQRQESLTGYLIRRRRRRAEKFLLRAEAVPLRMELARSAYLSACILFDALVLPEPVRVLTPEVGWPLSVTGLCVAVWLEYRFYRARFSRPERPVP
jgi:hypothetical protein